MGFADKITPASSGAGTEGRLYFITGAPGAGKTTLIGTVADIYPGELLFLNAGGGISSLWDRDDIATVTIEKFSQMKEASDYLGKKDCPFTWVAIDLTPEVYNICLAEVVEDGKKTKEGRATLEARGIANDRLVQMVRDFRILAQTKGLNVIFTSHTLETKDDDNGMILVRANLTPGTLATVLGIVDVAMYMEIRKGKRRVLLVGNERVWAKARKPLSYGAVPEFIEEPTFEKIQRVLNERV